MGGEYFNSCAAERVPHGPIPIGFLISVFPQHDFSNFVLPLWEELKNNQFLMYPRHMVRPSYLDSELILMLGKYLPNYTVLQVLGLHEIFSHAGIASQKIEDCLVPKSPPIPISYYTNLDHTMT